MHHESHRQVAAARLVPDGGVLTIVYADGEWQTATPVDPATAAEIAAGWGLTPGGTSDDGVRHWWR